MSLRQLLSQLDPMLKETFEDQDLDSHEWFQKMENIVRDKMPRRYYLMEPYQVVLNYVRWKGNKNEH